MNMYKTKYRNIALIAVFGALWGLAEATGGAILHFFHLPFSGLVMTFIASLFVFPAIRLINARGAAIHMALIACVIKLFSIGGFKIGPAIAIGMEGVLLELLFPFFKRGMGGFIVCGIVFCLAPLLHQFFIASLLFGAGAVEFVNGIHKMYPSFHFSAGMIVAGYAGVHVISGCLAGLLSWRIDRNITFRLQ